LSDDDQRRGGARLHEIADIDEPQAGDAVDRRGYQAVGDVQPGGIDLRLVAPDRSLELLNHGALRILLLARHRQLVADDRRITGEVPPRVFEIGLVLGLVGLGLPELRLIGPEVDLHQQVSLVQKLAFGKGNLDDIAVDAALDCDLVEGLNRADAPHDDRHVLSLTVAARTGTASCALS